MLYEVITRQRAYLLEVEGREGLHRPLDGPGQLELPGQYQRVAPQDARRVGAVGPQEAERERHDQLGRLLEQGLAQLVAQGEERVDEQPAQRVEDDAVLRPVGRAEEGGGQSYNFV